MKVLNYLEVSKIWNGSVADSKSREIYYSIAEYASKHGLSMLDFYNQPFEPELVPELFKGWKMTVVDDIKQLIHKDSFISIELYKNYIVYIVIDKDKCKCTNATRMVIPETLNDFIRDCQRVVIELEWRMK